MKFIMTTLKGRDGSVGKVLVNIHAIENIMMQEGKLVAFLHSPGGNSLKGALLEALSEHTETKSLIIVDPSYEALKREIISTEDGFVEFFLRNKGNDTYNPALINIHYIEAVQKGEGEYEGETMLITSDNHGVFFARGSFESHIKHFIGE